MSDSPLLPVMTLQERLKKADYLTRELSEHLKQAYLPKLAALRSSAKVYDPDDVSDTQILEHALAVIEAEEFTDNLYQTLRQYLDSISREMGSMLFAEKKAGSKSRRADEIVFDIDDILNES